MDVPRMLIVLIVALLACSVCSAQTTEETDTLQPPTETEDDAGELTAAPDEEHAVLSDDGVGAQHFCYAHGRGSECIRTATRAIPQQKHTCKGGRWFRRKRCYTYTVYTLGYTCSRYGHKHVIVPCHNHGRPGRGRPGRGRPGYGRPGYGRPGYGRPGYGRPGRGNPGRGGPGYGTPGNRSPGWHPDREPRDRRSHPR